MANLQLNVLQMAQLLNAEIVNVSADVGFLGAQIDSRKLIIGNLFVALAGERVDGHDYLPQAAASGASCALVERPIDCDLPQLVVKNVIAAFQTIAAHYLQKLRANKQLKIIAITGSAGKTTTKQMLLSICSAFGESYATEGNLNNHLGVPLTIMALRPEHQFAVIETGASKPGDIKELAEIVRPDVAVLTNVGSAHVEGFGSEQAIATEKGELFAGLVSTGIAVVNNDQPWQSTWNTQIADRTAVTFGQKNSADINLLDVQETSAGQLVSVKAKDEEMTFELPMKGSHNALNAAAAVAAAQALGFDLEKAAGALERLTLPAGRMAISKLQNGATIVDDSYNANPLSMRAALQWLASCDGYKICALGEMAELGNDSLGMHKQLGETAKQLNINELVAVGNDAAAQIVAGFGGGERMKDHESAANYLTKKLTADTTLLVKGSRSAAMERLVELLTAQRA